MLNFWQKLLAQASDKKPILALAPMAGVSDSAFRQICREQGADVVYTEMISADGLYYDSAKTLALLKFQKKEKPVVAQLFGKHPERFTKAAAVCEQLGFDGIDINFGCPAKKVAGHGGGVTLMRDLVKCREIIQAVLAGTKLPVSVKIRSSINAAAAGGANAGAGKSAAKKITALDFLAATRDLPLAAVMIHGRSYEQPFNGAPDYAMIKKVTTAFKKYHSGGAVLGNGGIKEPADARVMMEKTGCDGVGLARGVYGRPWLFRQIKTAASKAVMSKIAAAAIKSSVATKSPIAPPTAAQIKKIILRHAGLAFKAKGEHGLTELRKHFCWYTAGWPDAKKWRAKLVKIDRLDKLEKIL